MRRLRLGEMWRGGGLMLVALALALRLAAPTGWMVAPGEHGAQMIICTGHTPATQAPAEPGHAPTSPDHPCAFAGHATPTPTAPILTPARSLAVAFVEPAATPAVDQRPGLGLAAPPPPPLGPPATA